MKAIRSNLSQHAPPPAVLCFLLWLAGFAGLPTATRAQAPGEYQVKAAFIYNFGKFVEWPGEDETSPSDPFRICILGENPFGDEFSQATRGKQIKGHPIVVTPIARADQAAPCHVLFIAATERHAIQKTLEQIQTFRVLTVGESQDFAALGGIIRLELEEGRVRFEVNLTAAERARLKISSRLLGLAKAVTGGPR